MMKYCTHSHPTRQQEFTGFIHFFLNQTVQGLATRHDGKAFKNEIQTSLKKIG